MTLVKHANDPSTTVTSYDEMALKWDLPWHLLGGTETMRKAAQKYLPQDAKESAEAYTARLNRSFLFNAYSKTVNTMVGKVFSKPIVLKDDVDKDLKDMWENIDLEGRNGDLLMEEVFAHAVGYGHCHFLVDMPTAPENATLQQEKELGIRPYWVKVTPQQLVGWRSVRVGPKQMLTDIRIREDTIEADGDFGERSVTRIRQIGLTSWQLFEQITTSNDPRGANGAWVIVAGGPMTLGFIPLHTVYANRTGFMTSLPPLMDLAWLNVAHWQSQSDQRHILHVARVPIMFGSGLGENADEIIVGPNRLVNGPAGSDLKYVEHSGKAIESGAKDLEDLEDRMKVMGLELLLPSTRGGGQTATAKSLDYADINSPLQFMARGLGDTIELGLQTSALWLKKNKEAGGSVKVNTDFGITLRDAADVQSLLQARIAGEISKETFWAELKRRNILSEDFDATAEDKLLATEAEQDAQKMVDQAKALAATKPAVPGAAPGTPPGIGSDKVAN